MKDKHFLTIIEFAELVNAHPNTIRRAIKSGRIAAFRIGSGKKSAFRIDRSEVRRMAEFDVMHYIDMEVQKRLSEERKIE